MTLANATKKYLGKLVLVDISVDSIPMAATVKDVKKRFGRIDLLVTPSTGQGEGWISDKFVALNPRQYGR